MLRISTTGLGLNIKRTFNVNNELERIHNIVTPLCLCLLRWSEKEIDPLPPQRGADRKRDQRGGKPLPVSAKSFPRLFISFSSRFYKKK